MGFGPAPAVRKVLAQTGLTLAQMDVIELNHPRRRHADHPGQRLKIVGRQRGFAGQQQRAGTIVVQVPQRKGEPLRFSRDEHPRSTSLEALAKLRGVVASG
jgi:acetyl-CoA acetyltransferase